jgi:hypothetical protein
MPLRDDEPPLTQNGEFSDENIKENRCHFPYYCGHIGSDTFLCQGP